MRNLTHYAVRGVAILVAVIVMFLLLDATVVSKNTLISVRIVISYVTVIGGGVALINLQERPDLSKSSLFAAFITLSIRSSWIAISDFFRPETGFILLTETRFLHDLADIALVVFLIFLSLVLELHNRTRDSMKPLYIGCYTVLVFLASTIYHYLFDVILQSIQGSFLLGSIVATITILSVCSLTLIYRKKEEFAHFDRFRLGSSFALFAGASLFLFLSWNTYRSWIPFTVLWVMGIVMLYLSVTVPKLRSIIGNHIQAYALAVAPCILILLPLSTVLVAESFLPRFFLIGIETYVLTHLGISVLSGILVYMLCTYTQYTPRVEHNSLIFILTCWSIVNIFQVAIRPIQSFSGESVVPIIVGTMLTTLMLTKMALFDDSDSKKLAPKYWIAAGVITSLLLCVIGITIETYLLVQNPTLLGELIARSLLLRSTVPMIGLLSYNLLKNLERERKLFSIESLTLALLALWLVPNILKGMYLDWTLGWWAGELILGLGLALALAIIGHQLVITLASAEKSQSRARLYSDLLMHDISNYHQMMLIGLDLAEMDDVSTKLRIERIRRVASIVRDSDRLVRNLREIISLEEDGTTELQRIEVTASLNQAVDNVNANREPNEQIVLLSRPSSRYFVIADNQLVKIFEIVLLRIVNCARSKEPASFGINVAVTESEKSCKIRFYNSGAMKLQNPEACSLHDYIEQSSQSLIGMHLVNALVGLYGGEAEVLMESGNFSENRCEFSISLPAAKTELNGH